MKFSQELERAQILINYSINPITQKLTQIVPQNDSVRHRKLPKKKRTIRRMKIEIKVQTSRVKRHASWLKGWGIKRSNVTTED